MICALCLGGSAVCAAAGWPTASTACACWPSPARCGARRPCPAAWRPAIRSWRWRGCWWAWARRGVPPSYAIITDYFPPGRRGTALSLFNLGPPIGLALGVAFGASIAVAYGWRPAFMVLGAAGSRPRWGWSPSCASRAAVVSIRRRRCGGRVGEGAVRADRPDVLRDPPWCGGVDCHRDTRSSPTARATSRPSPRRARRA